MKQRGLLPAFLAVKRPHSLDATLSLNPNLLNTLYF